MCLILLNFINRVNLLILLLNLKSFIHELQIPNVTSPAEINRQVLATCPLPFVRSRQCGPVMFVVVVEKLIWTVNRT